MSRFPDGGYARLVTEESASDRDLELVAPVPDEHPAEAAGGGRAADFRRLLAAHPDGIMVVDGEGVVRYANPAAEDHLEVGDDTFVGQSLGLPLTGFDGSMEIEVRTDDGSYRIIRIHARPCRWEGADAQMLTTQDVTDAAERLKGLEQRAERYALALLGSNDGLWDWDIVHGSLHVNGRWRELLGLGHLPPDDNDPGLWLDRTHDDDKARLLDELEAHLGGRTPLFAVEHRLRHQDGHDVWMLARGRAVRDARGEPVRIAGSLTDVSARKVLEERLRHEARHDPLTGLANRRRLLETIEDRRRQSQRTGRGFSIALLDLDGFKAVNDGHGHEAGDEVLVAVGDRLATSVRPSDVAARLGGDEFAVVIADADSEATVADVVERLDRALAVPHRVGGRDRSVGASIGVAVTTRGASSAAELLRAADACMYEAKLTGRPVLRILP